MSNLLHYRSTSCFLCSVLRQKYTCVEFSVANAWSNTDQGLLDRIKRSIRNCRSQLSPAHGLNQIRNNCDLWINARICDHDLKYHCKSRTKCCNFMIMTWNITANIEQNLVHKIIEILILIVNYIMIETRWGLLNATTYGGDIDRVSRQFRFSSRALFSRA